MNRTNWGIAGILLASSAAFAQTAIHEIRAELSAPFGTAQGRLIAAGDQLLFIDEQQPSGSFVIPRSNLQGITSDGNILTVQTRQPVRDRSGERTRLTFRIPNESDIRNAVSWYGSAGGTSARQGGGSAPSGDVKTFEARHDKRFGGSSGRLVVSANEIAYEALDDANDSRRWQYRDIKEIRLKGPYKLEIRPFAGDRYTLELQGQGMGTEDYKQLADRVAQARAVR